MCACEGSETIGPLGGVLLLLAWERLTFMGVTGMTIKVLGMGAGNDVGATSSLDAAAYGEPPFEPTLFSNFLVLCCTPVVQVCLINLVLGLVAFAVRSMQWVVFGRLRAAEWQARHLAPPKRRLSPPQRPALPSLPHSARRCPHSLALPTLASRRGCGTG